MVSYTVDSTRITKKKTNGYIVFRRVGIIQELILNKSGNNNNINIKQKVFLVSRKLTPKEI